MESTGDTPGVPVPARNDLDAQVMGAAVARRMFGEEVHAPVRIGRFLVLARVGAGGMGTVFRAYDPQLDRRVAVKLLRPDLARDDSNAERRMQREAVALAKLSHPNVVTIHEVGRIEEQTFLAMEYVDGVDLAQWMRDHPIGGETRFATAMDLLQQAGKGLAAAHSAGLVHRDFKPSNVLVGHDGRVRVADFGLVRASGSSDTDDDVQSEDDSSSAKSCVTRPGALLGTPRYMAPEQRVGATVDARSDQYSFCVTAWELLLGPPRPGDNPFASPEGAPRWIVAVLQRGLHLDPARRHPDLESLLAALGRDPRRRHRMMAVGVAALVAAGAGLATVAHHRATMCDDGPAALAQSWNEERRAGLAKAFGDTGDAATLDAWQRTDARLQWYAEEWTAARDETCDAGRRGNAIAPETLRASFGCFDQRLATLEATLRVLETHGPRAGAGAITAAYSLRSPRGCMSGANETMALPEDEGTARRVLDVLTEVAAARFVGGTGEWQEALGRIDAVDAAVAELDFIPLTLRADEVRIISNDRLGRFDAAYDLGTQSYWSALRNGEDGMAASFSRRLAFLALRRGDFDETQHWLDHARVLGDRAGVGDAERMVLAGEKARLLTARADFPGAKEEARRAIAYGEAAYGPIHPELGTAISIAVVVHQRSGDKATAVGLARRMVAIDEATYGPESLPTARALLTLSAALSEAGEHEEALVLGGRAVDLHLRLAPDDPSTADAIGNHAITLSIADRPKQAIPLLQQSIELGGTSPSGPNGLIERMNLAAALSDTGRHDDAIALARVVVAGFEATQDERRLARARWQLGIVLERKGEYREADESIRRALAFFSTRLGEQHIDTIAARISLARSHLHAGDAAGAVDELDAIIATAIGSDAAPLRARAELVRGEALARLARADDALASWERALPSLRGPQERVDLLRERATLLAALGRTAEARADAELGSKEARVLDHTESIARFAEILGSD